jgi:pentalenolactone synthase
MRTFQQQIEVSSAQVLDDLAAAGPPADLQALVAAPLPMLVMGALLGVPDPDIPQLTEMTRAAADVNDRDRSLKGVSELYGFGADLAARRRVEPGSDALSALCARDDVSGTEIAEMFVAMLFAGYETTVVQIGIGVLLLLTNPDSWQAIHDDKSLIGKAVEEILRMHCKGGDAIPRYAHQDIVVAGRMINRGDLLLLDYGSANHDGRAFDAPMTFDIRRHGTGHLTFGRGARYCVGAPLARLELAVIIHQLVERFPRLRLAIGTHKLRLRQDIITGGLEALPVEW